MSRIVTVILIYHRHNPIDIIVTVEYYYCCYYYYYYYYYYYRCLITCLWFEILTMVKISVLLFSISFPTFRGKALPQFTGSKSKPSNKHSKFAIYLSCEITLKIEAVHSPETTLNFNKTTRISHHIMDNSFLYIFSAF
jgi:hypothetical protein